MAQQVINPLVFLLEKRRYVGFFLDFALPIELRLLEVLVNVDFFLGNG